VLFLFPFLSLLFLSALMSYPLFLTLRSKRCGARRRKRAHQALGPPVGMCFPEPNPLQYLEGLTATYMWVRSHISVRVVPLQYCRGDSSVFSSSLPCMLSHDKFIRHLSRIALFFGPAGAHILLVVNYHT
jgi:hypothetical protein